MRILQISYSNNTCINVNVAQPHLITARQFSRVSKYLPFSRRRARSRSGPASAPCASPWYCMPSQQVKRESRKRGCKEASKQGSKEARMEAS